MAFTWKDIELESESETDIGNDNFFTDMRMEWGQGIKTPPPVLVDEVPLKLKELAENVAYNFLSCNAVPIVIALVKNECMTGRDLAELLGCTNFQLRQQLVELMKCKIIYKRAMTVNKKTVDDLYHIHYTKMVNMLKLKLYEIREKITAKDEPSTLMIFQCDKCDKSYRKDQEMDLVNMELFDLFCTSCGGHVSELPDESAKNSGNVRLELERLDERFEPILDLISEVDSCSLSKAFLASKPLGIDNKKNFIGASTVSVDRVENYMHPLDVQKTVLSEHAEESVVNETPIWFKGSTVDKRPMPVIKESSFTRYLQNLVERAGGSKKETESAPENPENYYNEANKKQSTGLGRKLKKKSIFSEESSTSSDSNDDGDMPAASNVTKFAPQSPDNNYDKDPRKCLFYSGGKRDTAYPTTQQQPPGSTEDPQANIGETVAMIAPPRLKRKYTKRKHPEVSSTSVDQPKTDTTSGAVPAIDPPRVKRKYTKRKHPVVASTAANSTNIVNLFDQLAVDIDIDSNSSKENATKNATSSNTPITLPPTPTVEDIFKYVYPTPRRRCNIYGKFKFPCKYDRPFIYDSSSEEETAVKVMSRHERKLDMKINVEHGKTSYFIFL